MTRIMQLFPNWKLPTLATIKRETLRVVLESVLKLKELEVFNVILPWREELNKMERPQELRELICLMLVTSPEKGFSASSILASEELKAFKNLVSR